MENIYYSPIGYWKGKTAIKKLSEAAKVSENKSENWLKKTSNVADIPTSSSQDSKT